jgi:hypothetical protein
MRKIVSIVTLSLVAAAAPSALRAAEQAKPAASKSAAAESKAKTTKPASHSVSGTVESYDASGKTLTVKGSHATWTFEAGSAQVWEGSKSVGVDALSGHTGSKVTVKYMEHDGQKAAESVRLAPAHVKTASKSK